MTPTRFDVIMPPDMARDLQDLEQTTGLSRGAIFQRALALCKLAIKTRSAGGYVLTSDADGTLRNVTGLGI